MIEDEIWQSRYDEVLHFITTNHRNPSRHDPAERGHYFNWSKHNKKQLHAGLMKDGRVESFRKLLALME